MENKSEIVKIVVFVPEAHVDDVREAMGKAGAGKIGKYTFCSFSTKGIGRFKPDYGAHPYRGKVGTIESVAEERIETVCERKKLRAVIKAVRHVHPYEEIHFDIYPLEPVQ